MDSDSIKARRVFLHSAVGEDSVVTSKTTIAARIMQRFNYVVTDIATMQFTHGRRLKYFRKLFTYTRHCRRCS